jgi:hypothetical protein
VSNDTFRVKLGAAASILAMNLRLRFAEVALVAFLAILGILLFCGWLMLPNSIRGSNWGFGPEWDCSNPGKGSGPVCIKHPAKAGNLN